MATLEIVDAWGNVIDFTNDYDYAQQLAREYNGQVLSDENYY